MDGRGHVEHRHGRVWVNRQLTSRGYSRNAECFSGTSGLRQIWLVNSNVTILDRARELEAGLVVLSGCQRE
jgi:hypothetical protein